MKFFTHDSASNRSRVKRRVLQAAAIVSVTALGVVGCAGSSDGDGGGGDAGQVVVAGWGGAIQDAQIKYIYEPFTEQTGIKVIVSGPPNAAKIKAMVDSGNVEWDLVEGGMADVLSLGRDYFEEFPDSVLNVEGMPEEFIDMNAVAYYVFTSNIAWNPESYDEDMESWADFWDLDRFPGTRSLHGGDNGYPPLEFALLADGVQPDNLYPLDVDRAFAKLENLKPHVPQWWSSGSQPGQMLIGGQADAVEIWSGRIFTLQEEGASIKHTWNDGMFVPTTWIVPKGAPNADAAFKLAEYSIQPEVQALVWGNYATGPTNSLAYELIDEEFAKTLPTHEDHYDKQFFRDEEWWAENQAEVLERWNEFVLG